MFKFLLAMASTLVSLHLIAFVFFGYLPSFLYSLFAAGILAGAVRSQMKEEERWAEIRKRLQYARTYRSKKE